MTTHRTIARNLARRLAGAALAALALLLCGCASSEGRVHVASIPAGARILIDGVDSGRQTPSSIVLSTQRDSYELTVAKSGYNPVSQVVRLGTDVDVMGPKEAVGTICISPCCCFLPLLNFLDPVDVHTRFRPSDLNVELEVAGQGARLSIEPPGAEVYLDGSLVALLDGCYVVTSVGSHELEVRAAGHRPFARTIRVDERIYQRIDVRLEVAGQGLLITGTPDGAKVYLDDQFQGALGEFERRLRAEPGPHLLRIEAEGFKPWQDVVQVAPDRWDSLRIDLELDGQGVIVRKPEGLPSKTPELQVFVDGQLQASSFDVPVRTGPGDHDVEIRVAGRETRVMRVRVEAGQFLDVQPGPKLDPKAPRRQAVVAGFRVHAPPELADVAPQDIRILHGAQLLGQRFGEVIDYAVRPSFEVTVTVRGYRPWSAIISTPESGVLELYPTFEKE